MKRNLFIKNLDHIDISFFDPHKGIIGETYSIDVYVSGECDPFGYIFEFSDLKKNIKNIIKKTVDHKLIIPEKSKNIKYYKNLSNFTYEFIVFGYSNKIVYKCPENSVFHLESDNFDLVFFENELKNIIRSILNNDQIDISLKTQKHENQISYTHGLYKHDGLCQRLFHGHRSKIEIFYQGNRRCDLEKIFLKKFLFKNIHFVYKKHITNSDKYNTDQICKKNDYLNINYNSSFGNFYAKIPGDFVFLCSKDVTVENIGEILLKNFSKYIGLYKDLSMRLYEGIDKGVFIGI